MKPWDEMSDEERVAWHVQHGETSSPEDAAAFARGLLQNPEALAEARRLLAEHDAANDKAATKGDAQNPPDAGNPPANPPS